MKIVDARGEKLTDIHGVDSFLPLFKEHEIKKVEKIVNALAGMDLENGLELLEKTKIYLLQAAQISSPSN